MLDWIWKFLSSGRRRSKPLTPEQVLQNLLGEEGRISQEITQERIEELESRLGSLLKSGDRLVVLNVTSAIEVSEAMIEGEIDLRNGQQTGC